MDAPVQYTTFYFFLINDVWMLHVLTTLYVLSSNIQKNTTKSELVIEHFIRTISNQNESTVVHLEQ